MIKFNQDGIDIVLNHTKKEGFTFYEEEVKKENECFIKPIHTEKRLKAYKNKDVAYFQKLYKKGEGIPSYDENKNLQNILV